MSNNFSEKIISWYLEKGRKDLPWRNNISPYRVWISEIMLQQTQVKTVIPYFKKFIERYPDIDSISQASEDELLAIWSGLGFYIRAQNIFKAKEIIKNDFSNKFPDKFEEILMLPGIGRSTAGAIMAIAYKKSYPILDANVKRVITRYSGIDEFSKTKLDKALWLESTRLKADKKIFEYTQGVMDLGATVCTAKNMNCKNCPLNKECESAFKSLNKGLLLPKSKKLKKEKMDYVLAYTLDKILLIKRDKKRFWQSLWVPIEKNSGIIIDHSKAESINKINISHKLSHLELVISVSLLKFKKPFDVLSNSEVYWINKIDIDNIGVPKPIKDILVTL